MSLTLSLRLSPTRMLSNAAMVLVALGVTGCTDVAGPLVGDEPGAGKRGVVTTVPAFVFVSNETGVEQLYRFRNDSVVRLTHSNWTDRDPHSAAGKLVFTSYRDGNAEVYMSSNDGGNVVRLTSHSSIDEQPALSPDGSTVLFVSTRSGTPRLWRMDASGAGPVALSTGSPTHVPERVPAWSPSGDRIAFTSTRTGTSQVWVMPAAGGTPVQVSFESGGAFDPTWSADGTALRYATSGATMLIREVRLSDGEIDNYAMAGSDLGQPACGATHCLVVSGAYGTAGDIVAYTTAGSSPVTVVNQGANEKQPAVVVP